MVAATLLLACAALQLPPPRIGDASAPSLTSRLQATLSAVALSGALTLGVVPAALAGPEQILLKVQSYEEVGCPESLRQGRAGGALGAAHLLVRLHLLHAHLLVCLVLGDGPVALDHLLA